MGCQSASALSKYFRKKTPHPTWPLLPGLQTFFLFLQCSGRVQSKNAVDLVEVSVFYKLEKTSGQTDRPKNITTVVLLYLIMAA